MKFLMKYSLAIVIVLSITMIVCGVLTLKSTLEFGNMIEKYTSDQCGNFDSIEIVTSDSEGVLFDVYYEEPGIDQMYVDYETLTIYGE